MDAQISDVAAPALPAPQSRRAGHTARFGWTRHAFVPTLFAVVVLAALFGRILAPFDAAEIDMQHIFQPPGGVGHLLGTDQVGEDVWSRLLIGGQISLAIAFVTALSSAALGGLLGVSAGYLRGWVDAGVMRLTDMFLALPQILISLLLVSLIKPGIYSVAIAVIISNWARYSRLVRGEVLSLREREFVVAAQVIGAKPTRVMARHLVPGILNILAVLISLDIGHIIILESSLSFLGVGVPPTAGSWGASIAQGKVYLGVAPWVTLAPSFAMMISILIINSFGNWMRDHFDPQLRARQ